MGRTEEIQEEEEGWPELAEMEIGVHEHEEEEEEIQTESSQQRPGPSQQTEKTESRVDEDRQRREGKAGRKQQADHEKRTDIEKRQENSSKRGEKQNSTKPRNNCEKPPGASEKKRTVLGWTDWRKDRELIGKDRWNLEWFHEVGLEVVEAGQGRGGECQYLSALVMADPEAWGLKDGRIVIKDERVDAVRRNVAEWFERHRKDTFRSGLSLQDIALAEWKGGGKSENEKWRRYLAGVRNGHSGQWGDDCTLMGMSGVLGRPIYALSCGKDRRVRTYDVSAPSTWGDRIEGAPLLLAHVSDFHYCPVKVLEGGEWSFVIAPVEDRKNSKRRKECKFLADERLVLRTTEVESRRREEDPGGTQKGVPTQTFDNGSRRNLRSWNSALQVDTFPPMENQNESSQGNHSVEQRPEILFSSESAEFRGEEEQVVLHIHTASTHIQEKALGDGPRSNFEGSSPGMREGSSSGVREGSSSGVRAGTRRSKEGSGLGRESSFENSCTLVENEACKFENSQVFQGRNHPFDQRPEVPASPKPALLGGEEEKASRGALISRLETENEAARKLEKSQVS